MKIPASPLLIASLALTSSTLAAPVKQRETTPSPNPDQGSFDSPMPRLVAERRADRMDVRSPNPDLGGDRRRSVLLGHAQRNVKGHRRTVSLNGKRQVSQPNLPVDLSAATNILGTATGTVGGLAIGGVLPAAGGIVSGVAGTANGLIDGLPLGGVVTGVTRPLTGGIVDGLNSGNPLGVVNGALGGVGGAVDGLTGTVSGLLPGQLGGLVGGITHPLTEGLQNGRPVTGIVNTANGLVGTVGGILPGGLGDTLTGITAPLLGTVGGTVDGLIGQNGPLGGVLGEGGLVGGLLGGGGAGGLLGDQGLVGGLLGDQGLVGGLLGGNGGLLGGLTGGNGGLLGGLLGGGKPAAQSYAAAAVPAQAAPVAQVASQATSAVPVATLLGLIKQQGGVVRDLGNGQFLTKAGSVVTLPGAVASQLQGLLAHAQQQAVSHLPAQAQQQVASLGIAQTPQPSSENVDAAISNGPAPPSTMVVGGAASDRIPIQAVQAATNSLGLGDVTGKASALGSGFPYILSDSGSGKVPASPAALALAEKIKAKGQAMSDGLMTDSDLLSTLGAQAGTINMISLPDGLDNEDLGPISGLMLTPGGAHLIPSSVPSAAPTAAPSNSAVSGLPVPLSSVPASQVFSVQSAMASQAAASLAAAAQSAPVSPSSAPVPVPVPTISVPEPEYDDAGDDEDDYDSAQSEYGSDEEEDGEYSADVFPNFDATNNDVFANAVNVANSAYNAQGQVTGASSAMMQQDSAGLA